MGSLSDQWTSTNQMVIRIEKDRIYRFWYPEKPRKEVSFYMTKVYACWSHQELHQFVITLPQHGSEIKQSVKEFPFYQSLPLHSIIIFSVNFLSNDCSCLCTDLIFISLFCTFEKKIHESRCNVMTQKNERKNITDKKLMRVIW